MTDAFRLASPDGRPVDPEVPGSVRDLDASVAALLAQHDASRTDGPPPWPPTWAMYGRMWEERDKATAEVRRLRDLLARAIPHIDPNDSDDAHRLLVECEEATRG